MNKEKVIIQLDYLQGPIWRSNQETGEQYTRIDLIDNDKQIRKLSL